MVDIPKALNKQTAFVITYNNVFIFISSSRNAWKDITWKQQAYTGHCCYFTNPDVASKTCI